MEYNWEGWWFSVSDKVVDINPSKTIGGRKIINSDLAGTTVKTKYVWHHHQDAKTMMLVPKTIHSVKNG
ncbi:MAG: HNH endonuclease [Reinekea sp.]|jgi:hypothetical protein